MVKQNTYAFIDSQNLRLGVKSQNWELDYKKFRILLKNKYQVDKAFLFIGYIKSNEKLYSYLTNAGYIVIFKPVLYKNSKKTEFKGSVDAELILHAMIEYNNYNKAVIVSSDGDFYCLVKYLASRRKLKKIIAPSHKYSSLLKSYSKYIVLISIFRNKLEKK